MELEFATTGEILTELFNRKTFIGVIISSAKEHLSPHTNHDDFRMSTAVTREQTIHLLEYTIERLKNDLCID